ncbi:unnamed protein product [Closterium sp. Yama58-4]|nr:unnamed protein product [Closterium sp. Yama58-4]
MFLGTGSLDHLGHSETVAAPEFHRGADAASRRFRGPGAATSAFSSTPRRLLLFSSALFGLVALLRFSPHSALDIRLRYRASNAQSSAPSHITRGYIDSAEQAPWEEAETSADGLRGSAGYAVNPGLAPRDRKEGGSREGRRNFRRELLYVEWRARVDALSAERAENGPWWARGEWSWPEKGEAEESGEEWRMEEEQWVREEREGKLQDMPTGGNDGESTSEDIFDLPGASDGNGDESANQGDDSADYRYESEDHRDESADSIVPGSLGSDGSVVVRKEEEGEVEEEGEEGEAKEGAEEGEEEEGDDYDDDGERRRRRRRRRRGRRRRRRRKGRMRRERREMGSREGRVGREGRGRRHKGATSKPLPVAASFPLVHPSHSSANPTNAAAGNSLEAAAPGASNVLLSEAPRLGEAEDVPFSKPPQLGDTADVPFLKPPKLGETTDVPFSKPPQSEDTADVPFSKPPQSGETAEVPFPNAPRMGSREGLAGLPNWAVMVTQREKWEEQAEWEEAKERDKDDARVSLAPLVVTMRGEGAGEKEMESGKEREREEAKERGKDDARVSLAPLVVTMRGEGAMGEETDRGDAEKARGEERERAQMRGKMGWGRGGRRGGRGRMRSKSVFIQDLLIANSLVLPLFRAWIFMLVVKC